MSRIRGIDRIPGRIERRRTESVVRRMRSPTGEQSVRPAQDASDREHARIAALARRRAAQP